MIETICMLVPAKYCVKFYQLGIIPSFSGVINTSSCRIIKMSISSEMEQNSFSFDPSVGRLKEEHIRCLALITTRVHFPPCSFLLLPSLSHTHAHTLFTCTPLWRLSLGSAQIWFFNMLLISQNLSCWLSLKKIRGQKGCKMAVE